MIYKVKQEHRDADTHRVISSLVEAFATECRKLGYWVENVKLSYNRAEVTYKKPAYNTEAVKRFWAGCDDADDADDADGFLPDEAVCAAPDEPAHGALLQMVMEDVLSKPADGSEEEDVSESMPEAETFVPMN